MVQAMIKIDERTNRLLNIIKAKYALKDKSEAIEIMASQYEEKILEKSLKPEYAEKLKNIDKKSKFKSYSTVSGLRKGIETT